MAKKRKEKSIKRTTKGKGANYRPTKSGAGMTKKGVKAYRKKNPEIKVLGMSATPVINNLTEGKSPIELITGKSYDDVSTKPRVPNAVTLFEKFTTLITYFVILYSMIFIVTCIISVIQTYIS